MNKLLPFVLLIASGICQAQTPPGHILPDGSTDMYLGMSAVVGPAYEGSKDWWGYWNLNLQAQWSNGIFLSGSRIGMHLSDDPVIEYGPLVTWGGARPQSISPKTEGLGDIYSAPSIGGFYNYMLTNKVQLTTDLLYGTGRNRGGIVSDLDARTQVQLASHQKLLLSAGLTWASSKYTQIQYGITPQQASASDEPVYTASAGIKDLHAGVNWNWELSNSWLLTSKLYATHLTGDSAGSPLVERTNNVTVSTGLAYRY